MKRIAAAIEALRKHGVSDTAILDMVQAMAGVEEAPLRPPPYFDPAAESRRAADRERARKRRELMPANWDEIRLSVFQRDGFICAYCGEEAEIPHCDHILPLSRGGSSEPDNLTTACAPCNISKGARTVEEWLRR